MIKKRVLVLCGGESAERDVSLISARLIFSSLDNSKYNKELIWISPQGQWIKKSFNLIDKFKEYKKLSSGHPRELLSLEFLPAGVSLEKYRRPDVVFPVLHGPLGEDGTLQGFLELLHLPYVGSGVLGSALGMDKEFAKILADKVGIPTLPSFCLHSPVSAFLAAKKLGFPIFVKPARLGSSVGISRVESDVELPRAVRLAFRYDTKILMEKAIPAREIECAVLGDPYSDDKNLRLRASIVGEIALSSGFYDYKTKYISANNAVRSIPAKLSAAQTKLIQGYSLEIFRALGCYGMGRVDFLMDKKTQKIYFNEINTIPGFTPTSMYPELWKASGINMPQLVDVLIKLALRRSRATAKLKKTPTT
jgi:D-alanine-D-alanine ligase